MDDRTKSKRNKKRWALLHLESLVFRGVFRTQSNIYDEIAEIAKSRYILLQKSSIIDARVLNTALLLQTLFQPRFQKQPPDVFCNKRCFYKFHKIHRKTPVPESLF